LSESWEGIPLPTALFGKERYGQTLCACHHHNLDIAAFNTVM
jgi:hypothetical protein